MSAIDNIVSPFAGGRGTATALALGLVWLTFAVSSIVFSEPAPYDALMIGLVLALPLLRLTRFTARLTGFLGLWLVVVIGAFLSTTQTPDLADAIKHSTVTLYLALSGFVLAGFIAARPLPHSRLILSGYTLAAILATTAALAGYFRLAPGAYDLFTLAGRARATFEDPNVYGPFMVPVILWLGLRVLTGSFRQSLAPALILTYLLLGLLLAFSRGAWLNAVVSIAVFGGLSFLMSRSALYRAKLIAFAVMGALMAAALIVAALSWSATGDLLRERATLQQSYDVGHEGRFAGQRKAVGVILDHPLGVGPLGYSPKFHHEDAHNVYLTAFLDCGWIGGFGFLLVIGATFLVGLSNIVKRTPFQELSIIALSAFAGLMVESLVVDTYHWRHMFVLFGFIWGFHAAAGLTGANPGPTRRAVRPAAPPRLPPRRPAPVAPAAS